MLRIRNRNFILTPTVCNKYIYMSEKEAEARPVMGTIFLVYIYICLWSKKNLNRTLEIDSPFQTLTVGLLVEFID